MICAGAGDIFVFYVCQWNVYCEWNKWILLLVIDSVMVGRACECYLDDGFMAGTHRPISRFFDFCTNGKWICLVRGIADIFLDFFDLPWWNERSETMWTIESRLKLRVRDGAIERRRRWRATAASETKKGEKNDSLLKIAFDGSAVFRAITIYHAICGSITIFIDFKCKQMLWWD